MRTSIYILICISVALSASNGYVQQHRNFKYEPQRYHLAGNAQIRSEKISKETLAEGIGRLTTSLLNDIYSMAGNKFNIVMSPLSIWTILVILLEGSGGNTEQQLLAKLNVTQLGPNDGRKFFRKEYREIKNLLLGGNSHQTEFFWLNYLIADKKLSSEFTNIMENFYDGKFFKFDRKRKGLFSIMMNNWASDKSNGKISNIISPDDLDGLVMLIGNAVYFNAKWKYPFDPLDTLSMPFKNENGETIQNVMMMNKAIVLPLGYNYDLDSQIVEIPYSDNKTSMVVVLPRQGVSLNKVLNQMRKMSLRQIIPFNMSEETVQLTLPRFRVVGRMYLNEIFKKELSTLFHPEEAEFPKMGSDVFVSKIYHKAEIENTEEGTTAYAVTSVQFAYKSSSSAFKADRPFVYLIYEVESRLVLFAGTFSNPAKASTTF